MDSIGRIYEDHSLTLRLNYPKSEYTYKIFSELIFEQKLRLLERGIVHYLILSPEKPVFSCFFMQAMNKDGIYIFEVSVNENGRNMIYRLETHDFNEVRAMLSDFLHFGDIPDVSGWNFVGEFKSPVTTEKL